MQNSPLYSNAFLYLDLYNFKGTEDYYNYHYYHHDYNIYYHFYDYYFDYYDYYYGNHVYFNQTEYHFTASADISPGTKLGTAWISMPFSSVYLKNGSLVPFHLVDQYAYNGGLLFDFDLFCILSVWTTWILLFILMVSN